MRKATVMILIGFLGLVMISLVVRMGTWNILIKKFKMDNVITRAVFFDTDKVFEVMKNKNETDIDFKKEYPFTKNKLPLVNVTFDFFTPVKSNKTIIKNIKEHINTYSAEHFLFQNSIIKLGLIYEKIVNFYIHREVIRIGKDYWVHIWETEKMPFHQSVASINDFNRFLQTQNIPILYVAAPNKLFPDSINVYEFKNQLNRDKDSLIQELKHLEIPFIDLRENIRAENKDWNSRFYNTDHHWKTETGLWASKIIAEKLNTDFGFNLDTSLLSPQNYNYKIYENWFLGSLGRKVGHFLAKPDDFTLITPIFETKFDIVRCRKDFINEQKFADFETAFINFNEINEKDYYNLTPYESYKGGNFFIHNKLNSNGKKILMIRESYSGVVVPFLSILTEYLVDIEKIHFDGSLETLIEKEKPDIVIVVYYSTYCGIRFDFR